MKKRQFGCILLALVTSLAACGGDRSSPEDTRINVVPPQPSSPVVGFGSGAPIDEKPVVVDKPKVEPAKVAKSDVEVTRERLLAEIKLDKKSAKPHIELARSYIVTGERALAIKHASKAVKLAPESSQAHNTLGRAELLRHDYDAAIVAFGLATKLDANNVWAWNNLGLVYMTKKDYREAANALVEATSRKGTEGYMWNNLGIAYEQLDQLDDAREAFEHGAKLGSVAAKASRKRLEGVDTVAVVKPKVEPKAKDSGFEAREPMPEIVDEPSPEDPDESKVDEPKVDEPKVDEPKVDEPKVDEPKVEAKDPAPSTTL